MLILYICKYRITFICFCFWNVLFAYAITCNAQQIHRFKIYINNSSHLIYIYIINILHKALNSRCKASQNNSCFMRWHACYFRFWLKLVGFFKIVIYLSTYLHCLQIPWLPSDVFKSLIIAQILHQNSLLYHDYIWGLLMNHIKLLYINFLANLLAMTLCFYRLISIALINSVSIPLSEI